MPKKAKFPTIISGGITTLNFASTRQIYVNVHKWPIQNRTKSFENFPLELVRLVDDMDQYPLYPLLGNPDLALKYAKLTKTSKGLASELA